MCGRGIHRAVSLPRQAGVRPVCPAGASPCVRSSGRGGRPLCSRGGPGCRRAVGQALGASAVWPGSLVVVAEPPASVARPVCPTHCRGVADCAVLARRCPGRPRDARASTARPGRRRVVGCAAGASVVWPRRPSRSASHGRGVAVHVCAVLARRCPGRRRHAGASTARQGCRRAVSRATGALPEIAHAGAYVVWPGRRRAVGCPAGASVCGLAQCCASKLRWFLEEMSLETVLSQVGRMSFLPRSTTTLQAVFLWLLSVARF